MGAIDTKRDKVKTGPPGRYSLVRKTQRDERYVAGARFCGKISPRCQRLFSGHHRRELKARFPRN